MGRLMVRNINCLAGIQCPDPECAHTEDFYITATAVFHVTDDGTDDYQDVSWDDQANVVCGGCGYRARLERFIDQSDD